MQITFVEAEWAYVYSLPDPWGGRYRPGRFVRHGLADDAGRYHVCLSEGTRYGRPLYEKGLEVSGFYRPRLFMWGRDSFGKDLEFGQPVLRDRLRGFGIPDWSWERLLVHRGWRSGYPVWYNAGGAVGGCGASWRYLERLLVSSKAEMVERFAAGATVEIPDTRANIAQATKIT